MKLPPPVLHFLTALLLVLPAARAQWVTQTLTLNKGWNGVFLHVDASYTNVSGLVRDYPDILEIWRWDSLSRVQSVGGEATSNGASPDWTVWRRSDVDPALRGVVGDSAYLVRVSTNISTSTYTWRIKGRPVPPRREWKISGLNFIGFPTDPANPPTLLAFLSQSPDLMVSQAEVFQYHGGDAPVPIRVPVTSFASQPVTRGQAFWIRSDTNSRPIFNRYFGPFEVDLASRSGVDFTNVLGTFALRLKNRSTESNLVVTLRLLDSEPAPGGGSVRVPPLLLRTSLDLSRLIYGCTNLAVGGYAPRWNLAARGQPGSEVEVVLGLNRATMTGATGEILGGILRFTDSVGMTMVDVPLSAVVASRTGLWVGDAKVSQVGQYLKSYQRERQKAPATYSSLRTNTVGTTPSSLAAADLNSDGRIDFVSANAADGTLTVLTNQGFGRLVTAATNRVGSGPLSVISLDLNSDSKPDLVCANSGDSTLTVLTNNGVGGFVTVSTNLVGRHPSVVIAAELNRLLLEDAYPRELGSGYDLPDLVSANTEANSLTILTNAGAGHFALARTLGLPAGSAPSALAAADLNNDGWTDLVSANKGNNTITVWTNSSSAGLVLAATLSAGGSQPTALALADFNQDGYSDLVSANLGNDTLSLFTNDGKGGFALTGTLPTGAGPAAVTAADVNKDHLVDLVTANSGAGTLTIRTNDGNGLFKLSASLPVGAAPAAIVVADIMGNGGADLVTVSPTNGVLGFLLDATQLADAPVLEDSGAYKVATLNTNLERASGEFPLRLIIHNPAAGPAQLLQRVYCGVGNASNLVVATDEQSLGRSNLAKARRLSAVHLPWTQENHRWGFNGSLDDAIPLTTTVELADTDSRSNPFVHTYHPDHDNLNATFDGPATTPESYEIKRAITLEVTPPANDFKSLTSLGQSLSGTYGETVTLTAQFLTKTNKFIRTYEVRGRFSLTRIAAEPSLTPP